MKRRPGANRKRAWTRTHKEELMMQEQADWRAEAAAREAKTKAQEEKAELIMDVFAGLAAGTHGFKMVNGIYVIVPCQSQS